MQSFNRYPSSHSHSHISILSSPQPVLFSLYKAAAKRPAIPASPATYELNSRTPAPLAGLAVAEAAADEAVDEAAFEEEEATAAVLEALTDVEATTMEEVALATLTEEEV